MIDYKGSKAGIIPVALCAGTPEYAAMMQSYVVNLSGPTTTEQGPTDMVQFPFWFKDPPAFSKPGLTQPDCAYFGLAAMTRETAIWLVQESLFVTIQKAFGYKATGAEAGKYDCVTAQLMVMGAQLAFGKGMGDIKTYPLDAPMFAYYMSQSEKFQALVKGGLAAAAPAAKQQGITWIDNAGLAYVPPPQTELGAAFVGAAEPQNCAPLATTPGGAGGTPGTGTTTTGGGTPTPGTPMATWKWAVPVGVVTAGVGALGVWMWHRHRVQTQQGAAV